MSCVYTMKCSLPIYSEGLYHVSYHELRVHYEMLLTYLQSGPELYHVSYQKSSYHDLWVHYEMLLTYLQ